MKTLYLLFILLLIGGCMPASYPLDGFSEPQKVLVKAIQSGDVEQVKNLAAKTDLNLVSDKSIPLLTAAIYEALDDLKNDKQTRRLQVITELVRAGAPLDQRGDYDDSPIDMALMQEHPALLNAMLEGGLDPNFKLKTHYNIPIIFEVLSNYKLELVKLLVKYGADIEVKDSNEETPAHDAIITAPQISYYLVSIGANLNSTNKFTGETFAMSVFKMEKSILTSIENVSTGKHKGNLAMLQANLDAVQKIKAIMIEKGIDWPPKK